MSNITIQPIPTAQPKKDDCKVGRTVGTVAGGAGAALLSGIEVDRVLSSTSLDARAAMKYNREIETYMKASDGHALSPSKIDELMPFKEFKANYIKNQKAALVARCALATAALIGAGFAVGYLSDKITNAIANHSQKKMMLKANQE